MNSIGNIFTLTNFGESHGAAIGGVIDGMPAGVAVDMAFIQSWLDRRRPGSSSIVTARKERDTVEILSGVFEGITTGSPIGFIIGNTAQHSSDYDNLRHLFRPSHADYTYQTKYGIRDHRGGGRSSARETATRCVAGALAALALRQIGITVTAYTRQVGTICIPQDTPVTPQAIEATPVRCPHEATAAAMIALINEVKAQGDTIGGIIECLIQGVPAGLGEPVFGKLHAALGAAMLSINAAKGFEYGMGFEGVSRRGSEMNDRFTTIEGRVTTLTNHSGGIQGGISNGNDIDMRIAFKPVATLLQSIDTLMDTYEETSVKIAGRHDACVLPRAVPVVEAMAAMVMFDYYLLNRSSRL